VGRRLAIALAFGLVVSTGCGGESHAEKLELASTEKAVTICSAFTVPELADALDVSRDSDAIADEVAQRVLFAVGSEHTPGVDPELSKGDLDHIEEAAIFGCTYGIGLLRGQLKD